MRSFSFALLAIWLPLMPCSATLPGDFQTFRNALSEKHLEYELGTESEQEALSMELDERPIEWDVTPLIVTGPSNNRVDLVFFGDGYTADEKPKFLNDALRLATDLTLNQTFHTTAPLLNFWAAYTPSKESGVGVGGTAKDTPLGLYRPGTELRGLYYKHPKRARLACQSLGEQCDFPILLGNDPLYGGLGGEFTTVTASILNGPLVLRHELGHSIIDVGEEYDGGFAYFGVNSVSAQNISIASEWDEVGWGQWVTSSRKGALTIENRTDVPIPRIERSTMPLQAYTWAILNTSTPFTIKFNSTGQYPGGWQLKFSLSGIPALPHLPHNAGGQREQDAALRVYLDDVDLRWMPRPDVGLDRWHYDIYSNETLVEGEHKLEFVLLAANTEDKRNATKPQLCSVEVLEFGSSDEFNNDEASYGLYPTFGEADPETYRPTSQECLMRTVTHPNFCSVCTEGLWKALLKRVRVVEEVNSSCSAFRSDSSNSTGWVRVIEATLLPLAHLRSPSTGPLADSNDESYSVVWRKDGTVLSSWENSTRIEVDDGQGIGNWTVEAQFHTREMKKDPEGLLRGTGSIAVGGHCQ